MPQSLLNTTDHAKHDSLLNTTDHATHDSLLNTTDHAMPESLLNTTNRATPDSRLNTSDHAMPDSLLNATDRATPESLLNAVEVCHRTPALCDETLVGDVQVEHVEGVVDGLDLAHLDEPHLDVLGCCHKYAMTMVLGLRQHLHHMHRKTPVSYN